MYPTITVFGHEIASYGLMIVIGILVSLFFMEYRGRKFGINKRQEGEIELCLIYGIIGAIVGAKILYLLTDINGIKETLAESGILYTAAKYVSGGFVFYGGLIGGLGAAFLYIHFSEYNFEWFEKIMVPAIPLFHVFGRIGCFLEGCCYGKEASWGIAFTNSPVAPNNIPLIPVQLIEAAAELIIFFIILGKKKDLLITYVLLYTPVRFIIEFFRGDDYRGFIGILSLSQIISIALFAICVYIKFKNSGKKTDSDLEHPEVKTKK